MRLDKWVPLRAACDPKTMAGQIMTFVSGHVGKSIEDYDIYAVDSVVYVVRDGCVGVYFPQGTAYKRDASAKVLADSLAAKFPRPKLKADEK